MVAIVGTRGAHTESTSLARQIAAGLVEADHVVVSGGAIGVDAAAHLGALEAGGLTVAVLGNGLDQPYPERNRALFERVVSSGGALLSPYPVDTPPRRGNFPARNILVAALAQVVVVVEAPVRSGALNTARHARELGVPVLAAAHGHGALRLLRAGAGLVEEAADVLHVLQGGALRNHRQPPSEPDVARVLELLRADPDLRVDEVARTLGWTASRAAASLLRLEVEGWVRSMPGGFFEVC
jgi:DNA processing protein